MTRTGDLANDMLASHEGVQLAGHHTAVEPFRPFPIDALPEPVARFVRSVAAATGTDPSWAALAALVVIAGCVGNRAAIILKHGWVEPAVLWAALVGKSGSTKSVVVRLVTRPLVELFKEEHDTFLEKMREYTAGLERYTLAMAQWKVDHKGKPATDPPLQPDKPRERRLLASDITVEKLSALLGENPLGLLVVHDELAGLVNSFNRYSGGKGSDLQSWLSMNDSGPLLVDRKNCGSTFVERASVSLLGTIQPFTLGQVFGSAEREAGLLARILLTYPPDHAALWSDAELPEEEVVRWRDLLTGLLALQPAEDDAGRPRPRMIGVAGDAKARFVQWHDRHARELAELPDDHLRAHWCKLKGMCARIALLFSCTEAAFGRGVSGVPLARMERAIEVTQWLKAESCRIYAGLRGAARGPSQKLMDWVAGQGGTATVRELTHGLWAYRGNAQAAREALDGLVKSGLGRWACPRPSARGGRPPEVFELEPGVDITIAETPGGASMSGGFGDGEEGHGS